jgi:hypothetical protein
MVSLHGDHHPSETREVGRGPVTCIALTLILSAVFWIGLIWAAVRLYG